jgi:hypothetical protein
MPEARLAYEDDGVQTLSRIRVMGRSFSSMVDLEWAKHPLLNVSLKSQTGLSLSSLVVIVGTTATVVEENLNKWLHLGTTWEAVLLFDEADVYLESRQQGDFERNTLVSVFLRSLEYYQGLLFLTTNRVGSFDEAILSRVHIVLHFLNFNDTEREQIWETSIRKLNAERKDIVLGVGILEYAYSHQDIKSLSWNGREIRNAFNTIVALAE